jgi:hypothetical protein
MNDKLFDIYDFEDETMANENELDVEYHGNQDSHDVVSNGEKVQSIGGEYECQSLDEYKTNPLSISQELVDQIEQCAIENYFQTNLTRYYDFTAHG